MNQLERIDFSYNKLISVPDMSAIDSLSEIDLQENSLENFPWSLLEKINLKTLVVRNNPFILTEKEREFLMSRANKHIEGETVLVY